MRIRTVTTLGDPSLNLKLVDPKGNRAKVRIQPSAFPSVWPTEDHGYGDPERIERPAAMVIRDLVIQVPCRAPPYKVCSPSSFVFLFFFPSVVVTCVP
jgi:hypothetical protein